MWRWILVGAMLLPISAVAQQSVLPGSEDSLANYQIPTCSKGFCNRQVVEPTAALQKVRRPIWSRWGMAEARSC